MRQLTDASTRVWDVAVGKESWGTLVLLFAPRDGGEMRKAVLPHETSREAEVAFAAMSDAELQSLLSGSSSY